MSQSPSPHRQLLTVVLCGVFLFTGLTPAYSCSPEFPEAVMLNGIHPDFPFKYFAAGQLGIIQQGWAQSYLIVAYRYLSGLPLDKDEQTSIYAMWHKRLAYGQTYNQDPPPNPCLQYFLYRANVLGEKPQKDATRSDFAYAENVCDDAFANALTNLKNLVNHYGKKSAQVKEWIAAQDCVFGANLSRSQSDPPPAPAGSDPLIKAHRQYQQASARFYANDFAGAQELFVTMAKAPDCPWKDLAEYMAARCRANAVLAPNDTSESEPALAYVRHLVGQSGANKFKEDLLDLLELLEAQIKPQETTIERMVKAVMMPGCKRFGNDVADLTWLMDRGPADDAAPDGDAEPKTDVLPKAAGAPEAAGPAKSDGQSKKDPAAWRDKSDLLDWLKCFQQADGLFQYMTAKEWKAQAPERQEKATHALARWRKSHSLPWLVAAVSKNNLLDKHNIDLLAAVQKVPPNSPAYFTVQFYLIDADIRANRKAAARRPLLAILSKKDLPPTSRNMFMRQNVIVSQTANEYLKSTMQPALAITSWTDSAQLPDHWYANEDQKGYYTAETVIADRDFADDINDNLPQSYWVSLANDHSLPRPLRARIIRTAWLRSKLLSREDNLDDLMAQTFPTLRKSIAVYKKAPEGPEKRFELACLIFNNFGMTPYLEPGVERHGSDLGDWDGFHENFWLPRDPSGRKTASGLSLDDYYCGEANEGVYYLGCITTRDLLKRYNKPVLRSLLRPEERKAADDERQKIYKNHPSRFFGDAVFEWARLRPRDPRLPHLLYTLVKFPRWAGLASPESLDPAHLPTASLVSRQAYLLLHKQYPNNSWTNDAQVWY